MIARQGGNVDGQTEVTAKEKEDGMDDKHEPDCDDFHCLMGHCNCLTEECAESQYELLCDYADMRRKQLREDARNPEVTR